MKQLTCEMCGSTDLMKDGGVFVCQSCGCKYSVEEAKRMMIEGTVDVTGTVKVDNSEFVQRYLANARRAKAKEDWEETEKYYNMVEQNDPDNIEAIFYSAYGKAKSTLVDDDIYKRQAAFKVLSNCISVIDDHYRPERREENREAIQQMAADLALMLVSDFVFTQWKNGYGVVTRDNKQETYNLFINLLVQFKESIDNIQKIDDQPYLHEALITLYTVAKACSYIKTSTIEEWIKEEQGEFEAVQKKTAEAYWAEHPDEKAELESLKAALEAQLIDLGNEENNLPGMVDKGDYERRIALLEKEKGKLGLFAGKAKKAKQAEIDSLKACVSQVEEALKQPLAEIEARRKELTSEIEQVDTQLATAGS